MIDTTKSNISTMAASSISLLKIATKNKTKITHSNPKNLAEMVNIIENDPPKIISIDLTTTELDSNTKLPEITPNGKQSSNDKANCSKKSIKTKIKLANLSYRSLDNHKHLDGEVGEVPPLHEEAQHVTRNVKAGSSGRVLIIKSKTGKAIKLMMKNSSVIQTKQEINFVGEDEISDKLRVTSSEIVQINPEALPNAVAIDSMQPVITKVSTNVVNNIKSLNHQSTTTSDTKPTNTTHDVLLDDFNLIQNVSTIDTKLNIAQKAPLNTENLKSTPVKQIKSINSSQKIKTEVDLKPTNTCKKAANASTTEIFPLKIPYAPNKALQISSTLQRVPEFHLIRIANGPPKQLPPIKKPLPQLPVAQIKATKTRALKSVCKETLFVDNSTQTDSVEVQHTGNQTDSVVASPARTEDLPDIKDLVKYLLDNPEYSAGLDDGKKSDLLDMSDTIMRAKMFPVPCKVSVKPNSLADNLKMQLFIDLKDCVNFDLLGNLPIHNAIIDNHISNVKRQCFALKLRQISVNIENNERLIPLQMAILSNCDNSIIRTLLEYGGDTNVKDHEGSTLVHLAVLNSTDYNLELILQHCPALQYIINLKNDEGVTPLILAAINSKADMVEVLLKKGADPNLRDEKSGRTALFHAVEVNSNYVINLLLKYKADPKIRNFFGLTAMDAARDLDITDTNLNPPLSSNDTATVAKRAVAQEQNNRLERAHRATKRTAKPKTESAKKPRLTFNSTYRKVDANLVNKKKK